MCMFQAFFFLCGCSELKIKTPCQDTSTNVQGELFCRHDPHPHIDDSIPRVYYPGDHIPIFNSYGPGVCSNVHCRFKFGLLPIGDYGTCDQATPHENDTPFDKSEEARADREDLWYRNLSTDQQHKAIDMTFPRQFETMSTYAQAHFNQDIDDEGSAWVLLSGGEAWNPENLHWSELNPRYMSERQLWSATGRLLPAEVTIPGRDIKGCGTTPHKPHEGPFKVGVHTCHPNPGVCKKCGRNLGDPALKTAYESQDQTTRHIHPPRPNEVRLREFLEWHLGVNQMSSGSARSVNDATVDEAFAHESNKQAQATNEAHGIATMTENPEFDDMDFDFDEWLAEDGGVQK